MSIDDKYQGYSNRETWLVAIWIAKEQDAREYWEQQTWDMMRQDKPDGIQTLVRELEEWCRERLIELPTGMYSELTNAAIQLVDWDELVFWLLVDCGCEHLIPRRSYSTRNEMIGQGLLIDVTELATKAGFKIPVAITKRAWAECNKLPEGAECPHEAGRLWDVLTVLWYQIDRSRQYGTLSELVFTLSEIPETGSPPEVELKSVCGSGDCGEPVLTIMMPVEG